MTMGEQIQEWWDSLDEKGKNGMKLKCWLEFGNQTKKGE